MSAAVESLRVRLGLTEKQARTLLRSFSGGGRRVDDELVDLAGRRIVDDEYSCPINGEGVG